MSWRWDWILFATSLVMVGLAILEKTNRTKYEMIEAGGELDAPLHLNPYLVAIAVLLALGFLARIAMRIFRKRS